MVIAAVLTTACGLAPVNLHRGLFRRHAKVMIVRIAHVLLRTTLAGVGLVLTGTVLLIFDVVVGRHAALLAAGLTLLVIALIAVLPLVVGVISRRRAASG